MPNAINRIKGNQLCKVEKENENKDIKRKIRSLTKGGDKLSKAESVWDRLSKVKKSSSNDLSVGSQSKSRHDIPSRSMHRLIMPPRCAQPRKPLSPNIMPIKRPTEKKTATAKGQKSPRTVFFPDLNRQNIVYLCEPVRPPRDSAIARSAHNSKTSSEDSKQSFKKSIHSSGLLKSKVPKFESLEDYLDSQLSADISQESGDDFEMAPLMPVPTRSSMTFSAKVADNFREMLEQNKRTMPPEEIALIKDVVKTDERYRQLEENDPELFKDVLKTQLREILRQESIVQSALNNLSIATDSARTLSPSEISALPLPKVPTKMLDVESMEMADSATEIKPRVDVIFKNVPTLEKEIIILKALGEKLEATLRRTVTFHNNEFIERRTTSTSTSTLQNRVVMQAYVVGTLHVAASEVVLKGRMLSTGLVKEFRIANKTIHELKQEASRHFYIPTNKAKTELKRTNFKKLKQNPDVLMQHIKPKNSLVPFNVLDQDPIFFNNFLFNGPSASTPSPRDMDAEAKIDTMSEASSEVVTICEGGDSSTRTCHPYNYTQQREPLKIEEIRLSVSIVEENESEVERKSSGTSISAEILTALTNSHAERMKSESNAQIEEITDAASVGTILRPDIQNKNQQRMGKNILFEAPLRGQQRRRIGRMQTPMPLNRNMEPKNNLIRTVIIGAIQISVFLLLVMAVTYPDAKC